MRRLRRAKIVATLGPASSNADMIAKLFEAGADVFRINMSHTTPGSHARAGRHDPRGRTRYRPADRRTRRPAGPETPPRHI